MGPSVLFPFLLFLTVSITVLICFSELTLHFEVLVGSSFTAAFGVLGGALFPYVVYDS